MAKTSSKISVPHEGAAVTDDSTATPNSKKYVVKKNLDPNMIVTVKNGFNGTLVYRSKRTGEKYVWESFGDEQDMELSELKGAKNSYKSFFENNWFLFDDPEIIEWLGVGQYYKNALGTDDFKTLFEKSPSEIESMILKLSDGQKQSLAYMARRLIEDGTIDSIKVINSLEKCLSIELIER